MTATGPATFRATCKRTVVLPRGGGRSEAERFVTCDETFTGAEGAKALAAHMKAVHPRRRDSDEITPAWISAKPFPWKAPRPTPGGLAKVLERIEAGGYDVALEPFGEKVTPVEVEEVAEAAA